MKNSKETVVETKNPLYNVNIKNVKRRPTSLNLSQQPSKLKIFSDDEVSSIMQAREQQQQEPLLTDTNRPRTASPKPSTLQRISKKLINRKSPSPEPDGSFLRASSYHSPLISVVLPKRRNSVEISREISFRYRAKSENELLIFPEPAGEQTVISSSQSTEALLSTPSSSFSSSSSSISSISSISASLSSSSSISSSPSSSFSSINLSSPSPSSPSSSPADPFSLSEAAFCASVVYADDKQKIVAAATIDQLVFLLAGSAPPNKDFITQFLRTHYRFVDSKDFLQKLIDRYNLPAPKNISEEEYIKKKKIVQVRIINVIKKWIEIQLIDFQNDRQLVLMLQKFVNALLKTGGTEAIWASNLQIALLQSEDEQANPSIVIKNEDSVPKPILPKNMIPRLMQFLDIDPLELARQMTLIESESLCKLENREYMNKNWCSSGNEINAPNLLSIIDRFNKISFWIATEVVRQTDVRVRVKVLSRSIKILKNLLDMGNIQGLMAVYSALNMTPIQRLSETWKLLKNKYTIILKSVGDLLSPSQNYKSYRDHLRNAIPPFIPLQLEAPDKLENGTINFKKMGLIGTLLNELHQFQSLQHSFSPIYPIQEFLLSSGKAALDEIQLYTISKTIEPRKET